MMPNWADLMSSGAAVASAIAALFAYRAAAKSADVAERAEKRIAEIERAKSLAALLLAADKIQVSAVNHAKLASSTVATVRSRAIASGGFGGSKQTLYETEVDDQRATVALIRKTVDEHCPREPYALDHKSTSELAALQRHVDSMQLKIEGFSIRLIDIREGKP